MFKGQHEQPPASTSSLVSSTCPWIAAQVLVEPAPSMFVSQHEPFAPPGLVHEKRCQLHVPVLRGLVETTEAIVGGRRTCVHEQCWRSPHVRA